MKIHDLLRPIVRRMPAQLQSGQNIPSPNRKFHMSMSIPTRWSNIKYTNGQFEFSSVEYVSVTGIHSKRRSDHQHGITTGYFLVEKTLHRKRNIVPEENDFGLPLWAVDHLELISFPLWDCDVIGAWLLSLFAHQCSFSLENRLQFLATHFQTARQTANS